MSGLLAASSCANLADGSLLLAIPVGKQRAIIGNDRAAASQALVQATARILGVRVTGIGMGRHFSFQHGWRIG